MNLSEEAPKLPKFPFIAGDLVLIATAAVIATRSASPLGSGALLAITICVVAGAALAVIPFLADYARRQDAELTERQNQIAALARTTADSAEQLGIAATGLNTIAVSSKQNLELIERLPGRLQERLDELTQQLAGSAIAAQSSSKEEISQLEATVEKITRALARLDTAAKAKTDALASAEKDLAATLARATRQLESFVATAGAAAARVADLPVPAPAAVVPPPSPEPAVPLAVEPISPKVIDTPAEPIAPAAVPEPAPAPETPPPAAASDSEPDPAPSPEEESPAFTASEPSPADVPVNEPPAPKPPRVRKPKPADTGLDLGLTPDVQESSETAVTSDGFTRLIATAYIGIGNKLYIRGDGPGLSWDKGVPLQFVSIGKWRWESPDASAPISAKLYKNDQIECSGLGTLTLEPGRQHEVNAGF